MVSLIDTMSILAYEIGRAAGKEEAYQELLLGPKEEKQL
jgi:hypothetical protein